MQHFHNHVVLLKNYIHLLHNWYPSVYSWFWWWLQKFSSGTRIRNENKTKIYSISITCPGNICFQTHPPPPYVTYMRQWIGSALVQTMACRLFGTKPFSKPAMDYCQLEPRNILQWSFDQNTKKKSFAQMRLKMSPKWRPFRPGEDEF